MTRALAGACYLLFVAGLVIVLHGLPTAPEAPSAGARTVAVQAGQYLSQVERTITVAPGHRADVLAAGWHACGELGRGAEPAQLAGQYARTGIGGDLYSRAGVEAVVAAAPTLCGAP